MTKSDKRERAGAERFLESLILYEWVPTCGHVDEDINRVLRRDRRVRRKALDEAIDKLVALISPSGDSFDFARNTGISKAIDALRELRGRKR